MINFNVTSYRKAAMLGNVVAGVTVGLTFPLLTLLSLDMAWISLTLKNGLS